MGKKQFPELFDLSLGPKFVDVDLPEEALLRKVRQWGVDHFPLAVPVIADGLAIDRNVLRILRGNLVQIFARSIDTAPLVVESGINPPPAGNTPGRIVLQVGNALDHMPVPGKREMLERVKMVANERLSIQDDGQKMDRQNLWRRRQAHPMPQIFFRHTV